MNNPMDGIRQSIEQTQRQLRYASEHIQNSKLEEIERQERNNKLLEINADQNEKMLKLKETELDFLKNISEDTSKIVGTLNSLEILNRTNGTITEANMLIIQQRLEEIIANSGPTNINQIFLEEVKKQIVEKGVGVGIQFFIVGLKQLFNVNSKE
jgi:hypothetical protein